MHQTRRETSSDIAEGPPISSYWPPVDRKWVFLSATCLQNEHPRRLERLLLSLARLPVIQGGWFRLQQSQMESNRPIKSPVHANTQERTVSVCLIHASSSKNSWNVTVRKLLGSGSRWFRALSRLRLSLLQQMKVAVKKQTEFPSAPPATHSHVHEYRDLAYYNTGHDKPRDTEKFNTNISIRYFSHTKKCFSYA